MKAYWGSGDIAPHILWPQQQMEVSGQLHALAALPPGKKPLVGPRAILDAVMKRKIPSPCQESNQNPDHPAHSPVLYQLSYHGSYWLNTGWLKTKWYTFLHYKWKN
jgi:hypothetical protein